MNMIRLVHAVSAVLVLTMTTGCWDRDELNDLALVTALALDQGKNNDIVTTIQFLLPRSQSGVGGTGGGGGGGGGMNKETAVRTASGVNVADALSKLQRRMPRKLFWGQCKIFIFGEELAHKGIQESLDLLSRHPQPRERSFVFVSAGKASDNLELFPPLERTSAEALRKLSEMDIGYKLTLQQLNSKLVDDSEALAIPYIHVLKKSKAAAPGQTIPYVYGSAVMKGDRMIGVMSEKVTRGMMWLNDDIGDYTITFWMDGRSQGAISLRPIVAHIKTTPLIQGDQWMIKVKVNVEGDMLQNGTAYNPVDPQLLAKMDKAFEKDVRDRIELTVQQAQHKFNADIFDFAKAFHRKYPKQWEKEKGNWDKRFPQVKVTMDITAHILRSGLILAPDGMPHDEVIP
ncbi:Ger(x)C family spore germination protein [Paenibacillus sp. PR3]|uniref:Ger(X)C family spore germination protein n=1 Tax=Paenibacillus terricola TaxID=2763503 RepID=A0ABR8MZ41_9BACL|nr:Ger(x)C family spore germination protein [Paenibacillus terricola]MBD3919799.1 Ger(x)C family spore germination protein [Paenibacillus terricola]